MQWSIEVCFTKGNAQERVRGEKQEQYLGCPSKMVIDKATPVSLVEIFIYMPVHSWHNEPFQHVIANEKEYYHDLGMLARSYPMPD